jgi:hypothetical protein
MAVDDVDTGRVDGLTSSEKSSSLSCGAVTGS